MREQNLFCALLLFAEQLKCDERARICFSESSTLENNILIAIMKRERVRPAEVIQSGKCSAFDCTNCVRWQFIKANDLMARLYISSAAFLAPGRAHPRVFN